MMKILIVMNYKKSIGGITSSTEELANSLKEECFYVDIISTHGNIVKRLVNICKIFKNGFKYDLIIAVGCAYYGFLPILIGICASIAHKKRVLINFKDGQIKPFLKACGCFIKLITGSRPIVVASDFLYDEFKKSGFNPALIPNHFNYDVFPKRAVPFSWNRKFIWSRHFSSLYDPETALKACILASSQREGLEFHFFGEGYLLSRLAKKYRRPGIKFRGNIARGQFLKEYGSFSVLLNTSLYDNFPLTLVEAAYNELLVVSTKSGGIATVYNDDECLFFEKGDYRTLSKYIIDISDHPHKYDSFRIKMHRRALGFTWDKVRDKWLPLILSGAEY